MRLGVASQRERVVLNGVAKFKLRHYQKGANFGYGAG